MVDISIATKLQIKLQSYKQPYIYLRLSQGLKDDLENNGPKEG